MLLQAVTTSWLTFVEKIYAGNLGADSNPVSIGEIANPKGGLIGERWGTGYVIPGDRRPTKRLEPDPLPSDSVCGSYRVEGIPTKAGLARRSVTKCIGGRKQGSGMILAVSQGIVFYDGREKILVGSYVTDIATAVDSWAKG